MVMSCWLSSLKWCLLIAILVLSKKFYSTNNFRNTSSKFYMLLDERMFHQSMYITSRQGLRCLDSNLEGNWHLHRTVLHKISCYLLENSFKILQNRKPKSSKMLKKKFPVPGFEPGRNQIFHSIVLHRIH